MDLKKELDIFYYSTALCDLKLMNRHFVDQNITYNSLLYLDLIFSMNGKCTASLIAELMHVSKPAVTLKINELIRQGLVTKKPNPADHRQNLLYVNEETVPKFQIYRKQDVDAVCQITEQYSPEDIQKFCKMLHIISEINFREIESNK